MDFSHSPLFSPLKNLSSRSFCDLSHFFRNHLDLGYLQGLAFWMPSRHHDTTMSPTWPAAKQAGWGKRTSQRYILTGFPITTPSKVNSASGSWFRMLVRYRSLETPHGYILERLSHVPWFGLMTGPIGTRREILLHSTTSPFFSFLLTHLVSTPLESSWSWKSHFLQKRPSI